jgi:O-antigen/teichoic acid export membrane protein
VPSQPSADLAVNGGGIAVSRLIAAVASFLAVPAIVHYVGVIQFGVWESLLAMASLGTVVTGPAGGTLLWRMSRAWGARNGQAVRRALRDGIVGAVTIGGVSLIVGFMSRRLVTHVLRLESDEARLAELLFIGLSGLLFFTAVNETLGALNAAAQRARVTSFGHTAGQVTMYTVSIAGLYMGLGLPAMLAGSLAGQLVTAAFLSAGARVALQLMPATARVPNDPPRRTGQYFALLTIGSLSAALRGQTDRVVLAALASPAWAGYYAIAARLANLLMECSNLVYVSTIAAAGALQGAGRWGAVRSLFVSTMKAMSGGGAVLGILLIGLPGAVVTLWMGRPVPEAAMLLRVLAAGTLVAIVMTGPGTAICKGIGRPGIETRYVVVGLLLNVALTVVLSLTIGPLGTVVASSLSWSLSATYFAFHLYRTLNLPRAAMRRAVGTLIGIGLGVLVAAGLERILPVPETRTAAMVMILSLAPVSLAIVLATGRLIGGLDIRDLQPIGRLIQLRAAAS